MAVRDDESGKTFSPRWRAFDYGSVDRSDELISSASDAETPDAIPDAEQAHTGFDPSDALLGQRERWRRLSKVNDGVGESDRSSQVYEAGVERDVGVIASALDVTAQQRERAEWLLDRIDRQSELSRTASVEAMALAALTLAVNEDGRRVRGEAAFDQLCDDLDTSRGEVRRLREAIRETEAWMRRDG